MLILGLDPGTATTGYGLVEVSLIKPSKARCTVIEFGLIKTDKDGEPGKRLLEIHKQIASILKTFKPDVVAIEKLFFATNAKTAMRVGQAQGVMIFTASQNRVKVVEYSPGTIKKIVAGDGRADKKKVQVFVRKLLGAKVRSRKHQKTHFDNAADALAVALCHIDSLKRKGGDKNG